MFQVGVEVILTAISALVDAGGFITLHARLACGETRQAGLHGCYHDAEGKRS